ncbi:MAG TPA: succinate dehydrogenase cytochrome b subunit [Luteitalea sp.]|nr:succinate dehydrogenase cytochrome b subunit [Luteitalea sp.]
MSSRPSFFSSTVGSKIIIGLTGLLLFGFLVTHLAGNLTLLGGSEAFNAYAHKIEALGPLLYLAELGLVALFVLHIVKTLTNLKRNTAARPVRYAEKHWAGHTSRKSWASTTMPITGLLILLFVVIHVRTFKYGPYYVDPRTGDRDLFALVAEVYSNPLYVGLYVAAMILIGLHLNHGISSAAQSLGLSNQRFGRGLVLGGRVLAVLIAGGFAMLPVFMFFTHRVAQ